MTGARTHKAPRRQLHGAHSSGTDPNFIIICMHGLARPAAGSGTPPTSAERSNFLIKSRGECREMSNLENKLQKDRERFNRKVRRFGIAIGAALVLICGVLAYLYLLPADSGSGEPDRGISSDQDLSQPTVVPTADPEDPSQLILPGLLMSERHANPVRVTPGGKTTLVDYDILATALEAVKKVPQDELRARVDHSVEWEDFNDKQRREEVRGRVCQFRGTLRRFTVSKGVDMSPSGIDTLYEGQLQDVYGRWYSFYCFEKPDREIKRTDVAVLTGVFYKLIRYTTRGGDEMITPLIVARTITPRRDYRPPQSVAERVVEGTPPWLLYGGLATAAAIVCLLLHKLMKRRPSRYERRHHR